MAQLYSSFGEHLDTSRPLPEYPRPQLARSSYLNLNGIWRYAITESDVMPSEWDGNIVVPFAIESALSGVARPLMPRETLWYHRYFELPYDFHSGDDRILLHFGAVDQCCVVWLNGVEIGSHDGGYFSFTLEVTSTIFTDRANELVVMVIDETDKAPYLRGFQSLDPDEKQHTAVSGIWQTVWLECVPQNYVRDIRIMPQYDDTAVDILLLSSDRKMNVVLEIYAGDSLVAATHGKTDETITVQMASATSWTPENPFLYTVRITAGKDRLVSYFGMRKFSIETDAYGHRRFYLNNREYFCRGVQDQGVYSDGLYTFPSDYAMEADITLAKNCGFNTIRKMGKVEPMRWYYHCDTLGMLVWQDVPGSGKEMGVWRRRLLRQNQQSDRHWRRRGSEDEHGRRAYQRDVMRGVMQLYNTVSLQCWVLFDEALGQFSALENTQRIKNVDSSRFVDHASGWYDQGGGDIRSLHFYTSTPRMPQTPDERPVVFTSVGDFGFMYESHFGGTQPHAAQQVHSERQLLLNVTSFFQDVLAPLVADGLAGFFFRQLSDTGNQISGLATADRRVVKLNPRKIARLNRYVG